MIPAARAAVEFGSYRLLDEGASLRGATGNRSLCERDGSVDKNREDPTKRYRVRVTIRPDFRRRRRKAPDR
jgi:hypothetical protein